MIDYDSIYPLEEPLEVELRAQCINLISSTTSTEYSWYAAIDRQGALTNFLAIASAVSTWFYTQYPHATQPLLQDKNQVRFESSCLPTSRAPIIDA